MIHRSIEVHGAAGVSHDLPLADFYALARTRRIVDGPDAIHIRSVAHEELSRPNPSLTVST